jgi:hypothetical protein
MIEGFSLNFIDFSKFLEFPGGVIVLSPLDVGVSYLNVGEVIESEFSMLDFIHKDLFR